MFHFFVLDKLDGERNVIVFGLKSNQREFSRVIKVRVDKDETMEVVTKKYERNFFSICETKMFVFFEEEKI